jgi:formate hydrogenlyase transcriptional activator
MTAKASPEHQAGESRHLRGQRFLISVAPVALPSGEKAKGDIFASSRASTRKRAVEAQREGEEYFRTVANMAHVSIWMSGTDKFRTFFKHGWLEFTGRTMEEELGEGWALGVHPEDLNHCLETYAAAFDARSEFTMEYRFRRHDGEYRWIVDRGVPRFEPGGRFLGYIGSCLDITDRKASEQAIGEQLKFETLLTELSATLINLPTDGVEGQINEAQRRICEVLGLDRITLVQIVSERDDPVITHSWTREGFEPIRPFSEWDVAWTARTTLGGRRVSFARIDDLPEEAAKDKETFRKCGSKSNVTLPLSVGGRMIGTLAFESLREERKWPEPLLDRLGLVAQVFASALARVRADENLRRAYHDIQQLKGQLEKENIYLREEVKLEHHHSEVIGDSESIRHVLKRVEQVASTDSTVLLLGETGTGKELIAHAIHAVSRRKDRLMVKVNCAALPASLVENELFGREKGAYTGALTREIGRFELANYSTILLDEIGELPVELQSKLLRVLQEGEFERLGSPKTIKVNVRVIAATSRNLQQAVREGKFRDDLFYRLNVFPITIPPLRERREDIPALVWHFVNDIGQRMGRSIETIQVSTMEAFKNYYWPGNVRELRNIIERFLITSTNTVFRADLQALRNPTAGVQAQTSEDAERSHIVHTLELVGWRIRGEGGAAQILGVKPTTLESRMKKLSIVRRK